MIGRPESQPFDPTTLVDVFSEAAEVLHHPGPLDPKFQWVVEAIRVVTDASLVAYVDLGGTGTVRVATGPGRELAQDVVDRAMTAVDEMHRATTIEADAAVAGSGPGVVLVPVRGTARRPHGALVLALPPSVPRDAAGWIAEGLALHLGAALDTTATIARLAELDASRQETVQHLQDAVKPPMPDVGGVELGVHYQPAEPGAPIGGDLYDWHLLPDGDLHLAVVDVAGKGVQATKDALSVTHALRLLVLDNCPMEQLVARADGILGDSQSDLMATLAVARYRPATGALRVLAAGHPPPLLVTPEGKVSLIEARGIPIGWPGAGSLEIVDRRLGSNEALVMYTDGLIESRRDVIAGLERLRTAAEEVSTYPAPFLARGVADRALAGAARRDDSVVLVIRHRTAYAPAPAVLGPFSYPFSPVRAMLPLVRHSFDDWLAYQPVDPTYRDDLLFTATELCTNAVRASTGAVRSLELRARIDGDVVVIEVEDDGPGFLPGDHHDPPGVDRETGRGIFLVRALMDDLVVERDEGRNVTRCVKRAAVRPSRG